VIGLLRMRITRRSMIVTEMGRDLREGKRALVHSKLCLLLQRISNAIERTVGGFRRAQSILC
jgi:hypothetical protein